MPIKTMTILQEYRVECYVMELADAQGINDAVCSQYQDVRDDPGLRRTHHFEGRYENIYVDEGQIPALKPVLQAARQGAARFLHQKEISLSVGFWINDMGPGHVTVPHTHDEDDELVSGVYYVRVPENSGDLVLSRGVASTRITARQGVFVFFAPDVMHEVTENKSGGTRLSIGMNFGIKSG
ncbi:MAG: 2OG-Fe(II) oxygenase [Thiogranum sp.]